MISRELVAASSRPLVLSILQRGESYGYAILQEVRELSGGELAWTEGMLYPVLHRLEERGLIVARWGRSESGRRRKYYRLSAEGGRALEAERREWRFMDGLLERMWRVQACSTSISA
jgi:DNA-binding PadR family transcriptional regulator